MAGQTRNFWLTPFLANLAICGCQLADRQPYHGDPLLAYKKPVTALSNPEEHSVLLAYTEPERPDMPEAALLADARLHTPKATTPSNFDHQPANSDNASSENEPTKLNPRLEVFLTSRRKVAGVHGHASDYSWLQGTLQREPSGDMALVYLGPGQVDAFGGKVLLNDDRLSAFRAADVILAEGNLIQPPKAGRNLSRAAPSYRLRHVWLVRPAD
jgi:hypothetical protein